MNNACPFPPLRVLALLTLVAGAVATPACAESLLVTEVVTDPQADHSESSGGNGVPFDGSPGDGSVSSTDEFLELFNAGTSTLDLTGYRLDLDDSTPTSYVFGTTSSGALRFSSGSSLEALLAGGFVLVGNPPGAINNAIDVILRDPLGEIVDLLEIEDGKATGPADEAIARAWSAAGPVDTMLVRDRITPLAPTSGAVPAAPVPEPASILLLGFSALAAARASRRRAPPGGRRRSS
jgi:hypothetical protein